MRIKTMVVVMGALLSLGLGAATAQARWDELGCQSVGFATDRDIIRVGRDEGRFKAIRLEVSGNKIYLNDLKVIYASGNPDDLQVRSEIPAGGQTRAIDLKGERRAIRQIELVYRSQPNFRGQARVCAYGRS